MVKTLCKHGNSYALIIDKPIMDLLGIEPDTPLEVRTDGRALIIAPQGDAVSEEEFRKSLDKVNKRYGNALRKLGG